MTLRPRRRRPPRLIVRTLAASFLTVFVLLAAVCGVLVLHTRSVVRSSIIENLEEGQQLLVVFERQRQQQVNLQASVISETPTLKAALDTYLAESPLGREPAVVEQALATLEREVSKLAAYLNADAVAVADTEGQVLASAGPAEEVWRRGRRVRPQRQAEAAETMDVVVSLEDDRFRVTEASIWLGDVDIGLLFIATRVDDEYATALASVSRTNVAVIMGGRVVATTLGAASRAAFEEAFGRNLGAVGVMDVAGDSLAFRQLQQLGPASVYAIDSITAETARVSRAAMPMLAAIAVGALLLSAGASFWLARATTEPINHLSRGITKMAEAAGGQRRLTPTGSSAEVDGLVVTFNQLMKALGDARAETEAAYVGAIRALAAALDARDTYTAGHSERVSALSAATGRKMGLGERDLEVLRLGALLHDIGKIGIGDAILCKPSALTDDEFGVIKTHPTVGAQILRSISILEAHIPIVELHHEQPDGQGYPFGLRGDEIPPLARIVHVADAFDAMTTARAYRQGRPVTDAMAELWRHAGTQFDAAVVEAFAAALPVALSDVQSGKRATDNVIQFQRQVLWA